MATLPAPDVALHMFKCAVDLLMDSEFYKEDLVDLMNRAFKTLTPAHCMTLLVHVDKKVKHLDSETSKESLHEFILKLSNEHISRLVDSHARATQPPPQIATPASAPPLVRENKTTEEGATGDGSASTEHDPSWVEVSQ